jgi:hypothetical protein
MPLNSLTHTHKYEMGQGPHFNGPTVLLTNAKYQNHNIIFRHAYPPTRDNI